MGWHEEVKQYCVENILVPFEGYSKKLSDGSCEAYPDPYSPLGRKQVSIEDLTREQLIKAGNPWTIGFGSTFDIDGSPVLPGMVWSKEKAITVKQVVLNKFLNQLLAYSPELIKESPKRVAGILSWFYNLGPGVYRISTFRKRIDEKNWIDAHEECMKWNKAKVNGVLTTSKGLTRRRLVEALCILNG